MKTTEEVQDGLESLHAMLADLQRKVLVCAIRGKVTKNMANEVAGKADWIKAEFSSLAD